MRPAAMYDMPVVSASFRTSGWSGLLFHGDTCFVCACLMVGLRGLTSALRRVTLFDVCMASCS
jgi:hypothetical protein